MRRIVIEIPGDLAATDKRAAQLVEAMLARSAHPDARRVRSIKSFARVHAAERLKDGVRKVTTYEKQEG